MLLFVCFLVLVLLVEIDILEYAMQDEAPPNLPSMGLSSLSRVPTEFVHLPNLSFPLAKMAEWYIYI